MLGPSCQPPVSMALAGLNCLRAPVTFQMYSQSTQHAQKVLEDWKGESEWVFLCPRLKIKNLSKLGHALREASGGLLLNRAVDEYVAESEPWVRCAGA